MNGITGPATASLGAVVRALEGVRNRHALLVLLGGLLLVAPVVGIGSALASMTHSVVVAGLVNLLAMILAAAAVNACGLALMDAARGEPRRDFVGLLVTGAGCFARLLAVAVLSGLAFLAFLLIAAVLLFVCKLPFVGPVLLAVILPILVLGAAALLLALFVASSLIAPALWAGRSIRAALRESLAIVTRRPLEVLVSLLLLGLLTGVIGGIAGMFVFSGSTIVGGLAASILGGFGAMGALGGMEGMGAMEGMGTMGGDIAGPSAGMAIAGVIGFMVVFALVFGVIGTIQMNGLCHIYLRVRDDKIDATTDAGEAPGPELDQSLSRARSALGGAASRMAEAARGASEKLGERLRTSPPPASGSPPTDDSLAATIKTVATPPPQASVAPQRCHQCGAALSSDDRFCGECGARID